MDVRANGTTLYAEEVGGGPPLVFAHGMCGDARVWSGRVERLRALLAHRETPIAAEGQRRRAADGGIRSAARR